MEMAIRISCYSQSLEKYCRL